MTEISQSHKLSMMDFYPQAGFMRYIFKTPRIFWRSGLGPITGKIFILLTTVGRKSGMPRRTMIEYHTVNGIKYAACAFGMRSDWFKNILADPRVTIQTSSGTETAHAFRVVEDDELISVCETFKRRDPPLTSFYLSSLGIQDTPEDLIANKDKIFFVGFKPSQEVSPPGQEVDLAWLWPIGLIILLTLLFINSRD